MTCVTTPRRPVIALTLVLTLSLLAVAAQPAPLTVAAAADLSPALRELAADFEKRTGTKVALVFGSSGNLATQIEHGAPYDMFFSADTDYPHQLEAKDLIAPGSLHRYAIGKLVLFASKDSPLDLKGLGMRALIDPSVHKIAIANPQHAPYGRAAMAAMKRAGLYPRIAQKLVLGENVSQAAQFVLSGNAQIGIVPLSLALAPGMAGASKYWELPDGSYPPIEQAVVILKGVKERPAAEKFLDFVKSPDAAAILRGYGFQLPEAK